MKKSLLLIVVFCLLASAMAVSGQKKKKRAVRPKAVPVVKTAPEELLLEVKPPAMEFNPVTAADADGWRSYESKEDLFRMAFPATPVVTDSVDNSGKKDGNRYYTPEPVTGINLALTMTVQPLGVAGIPADFKRKIYQAWADGVMSDDGSGRKTTVASQKEFAFGDSFGLEITIDRSAFRFRGRIVCPADRCYQYGVGSGAPDALKPEENAEVEKWTRKFFDSFQLVK